MLFSMTGYGKQSLSLRDKTYQIELKTFNAKNFECNFKAPSLLRPLELEIRNLLQTVLVRGSVECVIYVQTEESTYPSTPSLNIPLIKAYVAQLKWLCEDLELPFHNPLDTVLRMPDVYQIPSVVPIESEDKEVFWEHLRFALEEVQAFRQREGDTIEKDMVMRIHLILEHKADVFLLKEERLSTLRASLESKLSQLSLSTTYDTNRLEQELIYYVEKFDFTEEMVRLEAHCHYFLAIIDDDKELAKGKKLSFVAQEILREINTLGSKAQHTLIQKTVIMMKDEVEKIKEQLGNVI